MQNAGHASVIQDEEIPPSPRPQAPETVAAVQSSSCLTTEEIFAMHLRMVDTIRDMQAHA